MGNISTLFMIRFGDRMNTPVHATPTVDEAYRHCRRITHRFGANFSVGFRFLPREKRRAVYAAYAFCRYADDIADDPGRDIGARLDAWEEELERCYERAPTHSITVALSDALDRFPIPKEGFRDLIIGCRQDLVKKRYETVDELLEYCRLVATSISNISLSIFGHRSPSAIEYGRHLSTALQLTNITRDIGDDLERDRIYLPCEELDRFGVTEAGLFAREETPAVRALIEFQIDRALSYFEQAQPLLRELSPDARFPTLLMGGVYATVLQKLRRDPCRPLRSRLSLSTPQKISVVLSRVIHPRFA